MCAAWDEIGTILKAFNERFWVISLSITFSAFLMELTDRYILDRGQAKDFREWLARVQAEKIEFAKVWKERGAKLGISKTA